MDECDIEEDLETEEAKVNSRQEVSLSSDEWLSFFFKSNDTW